MKITGTGTQTFLTIATICTHTATANAQPSNCTLQETQWLNSAIQYTVETASFSDNNQAVKDNKLQILNQLLERAKFCGLLDQATDSEDLK